MWEQGATMIQRGWFGKECCGGYNTTVPGLRNTKKYLPAVEYHIQSDWIMKTVCIVEWWMLYSVISVDATPTARLINSVTTTVTHSDAFMKRPLILSSLSSALSVWCFFFISVSGVSPVYTTNACLSINTVINSVTRINYSDVWFIWLIILLTQYLQNMH